MGNDLGRVLTELRQDHRNMATMLRLLERESNRIYAGEESGFELLQDIMQYMTVFPDAVHHPKEDRLYAELKAVRPDLSSGFARITVDHRNIAEQGMRLRDELASIDSGNMLRRKTLVGDLLRYVNTLRSHMQWEELDLFHRIEEMISDGHDSFDESIFPQTADPVFGEQIEHQFGRLWKSIEQNLQQDRL